MLAGNCQWTLEICRPIEQVSNSKKKSAPAPGSGDNDVGNLPVAENSSTLTEANRSLRRRIFDLYTLFEISRHLSSMLDVNSLLDAILFTCIGQMGVSGAAIVVHDPATDELSKFHFKGMVLPGGISWKFSKVGPLARYFRRTTRPQPLEILRERIPGDSEDFQRMKILDAELVVPLIAKGNLLGILFLPPKISSLPYQENDLEFISILVNQLSVALDNAALYEREKKTLRELQSAQQRMIESERLAALGRLSGSIAHEVNNPLGIINNYLTIISRSVGDDLEVRKNLEIVQGEVHRIASVVRRLLDFYRPTIEQPHEFDICLILSEIIDLVKNDFKNSSIEIRKSVCGTPCNMVGSSEKLKQVFLNLLLNSKDAMEEGGLINVTISRDDLQVTIEFTDTGTGIKESDLPNIFEPFFTTKKDQGTGLGLAVCYGVVRSHDGEISAANNPGGGARFTVKLPLKG
jgi:signal transduction histidine kinase